MSLLLSDLTEPLPELAVPQCPYPPDPANVCLQTLSFSLLHLFSFALLAFLAFALSFVFSFPATGKQESLSWGMRGANVLKQFQASSRWCSRTDSYGWRKAGTKAEKRKDVAEVLAMARVLEQAGQLGIQARAKQKGMSRLSPWSLSK